MAKRMCSVDGCGSDAQSRGWCGKHYTRWRRHGTPLPEMTCSVCSGPVPNVGQQYCRKPDCRRQQTAARYLANREHHLSQPAVAARARYAKTPEGIAARKRARAKWRAKPGNAEKERAAIERWRATAEGAAVQRAAEARVQSTAKGQADRRAAQLRYQGSYKDRVRVARYRAAKHAAPINDLSGADWASLLKEFDGRCAYCGCGGKMQQDHVWPLSRGGSHTRDNVVPACRSCNASKGARTLAEWYGLLAA